MTVNPLLAGLKLPGRIFQLPSKALFYKTGELGENVKNGEVHVHALSALEEIVLKNPDQLFSGAALDTVFPRAVSGVVKPAELLAKDVDALMVFLRVVTYGPEYEFSARHDCHEATDNTYVLNLDNVITNMKMLDENSLDLEYTLNLNDQIVKLRPYRYQQMVDLITENQVHAGKPITVEMQQNNLVELVSAAIESVDGISDPVLIRDWLKVLPSKAIKRIGDKVGEASDWGPDLQTTVKCKNCGEHFKVDVPINVVTFFTE